MYDWTNATYIRCLHHIRATERYGVGKPEIKLQPAAHKKRAARDFLNSLLLIAK
jgi:hypothetical protein